MQNIAFYEQISIIVIFLLIIWKFFLLYCLFTLVNIWVLFSLVYLM